MIQNEAAAHVYTCMQLHDTNYCDIEVFDSESDNTIIKLQNDIILIINICQRDGYIYPNDSF